MTYANKSAPKVAPSRLKWEDYHFEKDGLIYHDTYFGGRDFIGEEIVYENEKPVWGANYFGFVLAEKFNTKVYWCNSTLAGKGSKKNPEYKPYAEAFMEIPVLVGEEEIRYGDSDALLFVHYHINSPVR